MEIKNATEGQTNFILLGSLILLILFCCAALGSGQIIDIYEEWYTRDPKPFVWHFEEWGSMKINAETLLNTLNKKETNLFTPELTPAEYPFSNQQNQINWHQTDFLDVAEAAYKFRWKESPFFWGIYRLFFDTTCQDMKSGFYDATITYYTTDLDHLPLTHTVRQLQIYPQNNEILWGQDGGFPVAIPDWININVKSLLVNADDALRIAEENGGETFRSAVQNKCRIGLVLYGSDELGWRVWYTGTDYTGTITLSMQININSGIVREKVTH